MSKPLTFIQKVKIFRMWLKQQENGVIIDCALCSSKNIRFETQDSAKVVTPQMHPKEIKYSTVYHSKYTCVNCGAECLNRQEWYKS